MKKSFAFKNLVENAFDFLHKASREFEKEPKYSAIHFYAALELFLKARLLHEHWTLILTKPEDADLIKFKKGEFHSVSLTEAKKRLDCILQEDLTPDEFDCFKGLRDNRNRLVHFFHRDILSKKKDREAIAGQQCRAWFYLHRILTQRWKSVFEKYQAQILAFDKSMRKYRQYLKAKFYQLNSGIIAAKKSGTVFRKCPSCAYPSFKEDSSNTPLLILKCLVCDFSANAIRLDCPKCEAEQLLVTEPGDQCDKCQRDFSADDVKSFLTKDAVLTKDTLDEIHEANCGECQAYHSVVPVSEETWFCTNCFSIFRRSNIQVCEWCSDPTTEDVEDSYDTGCEYCDGHVGWHADD